MLTREQGYFLLRLARQTIENFVRGEKTKKPENYDKILNEKRGVFCTLTKDGQLRGCVGLPYAVKPTIDAVIEASQSACLDTRFKPVKEEELNKIKIELSILTDPVLIKVKNPEEYLKKIVPNKDGLIIKYGFYSGLFLPQVWKELPAKEEFLDHLCLKAGLPKGFWKNEGVKLYKFNVQSFKEDFP